MKSIAKFLDEVLHGKGYTGPLTLISASLIGFCTVLLTGCLSTEFMNRDNGAMGIIVMISLFPSLTMATGGVGTLFSRWMSKCHLQRTDKPYQHCWFCD